MRAEHRTPRPVRAVPGMMLGGSLAFDLLTPVEITPTPLLAATPAVALGLFALRGVVWTALATLVAELALVAVRDARSLEDTPEAHILELLSVAVICVAVVVLAIYQDRARRRYAEIENVAETVQRAVLPTPPSHIGGMPLSVSYHPAHTEALIGGDAYAIVPTERGVRLMVADVRGKGLGAIGSVAALLGGFRTAAYHAADLAEVAGQLEHVLSTDPETETFATAVFAEIPAVPDGHVQILNRGHPAPILLTRDAAEAIDPSVPALPLGLAALEDAPASIDSAAFPPGATLVLYTDGVSEARDDDGRFLDPHAVLAADHPIALDPDSVTGTLRTAVARHTGGRSDDDATVLAVHRPAAA